MVKKCALLTITDGTNYGNRLQNYALQEVIKSLGFQVDTIKRETSHDLPAKVRMISDIKYLVKKIIGWNIYDEGKRLRTKKFKRFNKEYISFSTYLLQNSQAPKCLKEKYDFFVCGSDQIWNSRFRIVQEDILNHLAFFAEPNQKIAYAASFGTSDIPEEYQKYFTQLLPTFKAIGVREYSGVDLVHQMCGRNDTEVVLDPTLLLGRKEWDKIAKEPAFYTGEKYILTYFLGGRNSAIKKRISELSTQYNAVAINLDKEGFTDHSIDNMDAYSVSPDEFVWLIQNAELVLTDSFHACVFSIIYHKKFVPFQRKAVEANNNMSGRLDTLFKKMGIQQEIDSMEEPHLLPKSYDTEAVDTRLEQERNKSIDFLKNALEV